MQFNFRLSEEERKDYFDRVLNYVVNNENIDEIEDAVSGNINIGDGGEENGDDIDGYFSDEEIGEVEFEIDEQNDSDFEESEDSDAYEYDENGNDGIENLSTLFVINVDVFLCFIFFRCFFYMQRWN